MPWTVQEKNIVHRNLLWDKTYIAAWFGRL